MKVMKKNSEITDAVRPAQTRQYRSSRRSMSNTKEHEWARCSISDTFINGRNVCTSIKIGHGDGWRFHN